MTKLITILLGIFVPGLIYASTASDFTVNRQSTYAVPRDVSNVLVLDLTLPDPLENGTLQVKSIKIHNAGTATHLDISKLIIWEDGPSIGWDNDETEVAKILTTPFFDTEISGSFRKYSKGDPWQRIFVTLDNTSAIFSTLERSIKPELFVNSVVFSDSATTGPTDENIVGFERIISHDASIPTIPTTPLASKGEALSASTIRWHFTDLSNNEFGFKILDGNLKTVVRKEEANLSYLDETGLLPDTEYSSRRIVAFNDRGESLSSSLAIFSAVSTLVLPEIEEVRPPEEGEPQPVEEIEKPVEPSLLETIQQKIAEIQQKINELINQFSELLKEQITKVSKFLAGLWITLF